MEGNARYVAGESINPGRSQKRREEVSKKQKPHAIVIGCSDSRVSPEIIFDQGIGDLFIIRVIGNVVGPVEIESIEYAAEVLGTSLVVVLGHESCGAVQAVLAGKTADIEDVAKLIGPVVKNVRPRTLEAAVKANVKHVASELRKTPALARLIEQGHFDVQAAYYSLDDGRVELMKQEKSRS
jgi:carbonic anhydrase